VGEGRIRREVYQCNDEPRFPIAKRPFTILVCLVCEAGEEIGHFEKAGDLARVISYTSILVRQCRRMRTGRGKRTKDEAAHGHDDSHCDDARAENLLHPDVEHLRVFFGVCGG
jgi:hypothetical protein